jgi:hypothetical protein
MAITRLVVDKTLLIAKIERKQADTLKEYEREVKAYEKAKIAYEKSIALYVKKVTSLLAKSNEITYANVSDDWEWINNARQSTGVDVRLTIKGVFASEFDTMPNKPSEPIKPENNSNYNERANMLSYLEMTSKDEIALPVDWSKQYL